MTDREKDLVVILLAVVVTGLFILWKTWDLYGFLY